MLLLLTLHIVKTFLRQRGITVDFNRLFARLIIGVKYGIPFFLISFSTEENVITEYEIVRFNIVKKERKLGFIDLEKIKTDQITKFVINSEVNAKVLFNFKAKSKETYIYKNDTLIYSAMYRTLNKRVKVNQSISFNRGNYYLTHKNKDHLLDVGVIKCNLVKLFFDEPVDIKEVYCDKLQINLNVIHMAQHTYKVVFPDKSYNIFYYEHGKCRLIKVIGSFYKVELVPNYKN